MFMDKSPMLPFRGQPVIDGSFRSTQADYSLSPNTLTLTYKDDANLQRGGGLCQTCDR